MKRIGKIGKINTEANKKLKEIFTEKKIYNCELCHSPFFCSFHHRHKRLFYRSCPELLSDFNQVVLLCAKCHDEAERDKEHTKDIFMKLRGEEIDNTKKLV